MTLRQSNKKWIIRFTVVVIVLLMGVLIRPCIFLLTLNESGGGVLPFFCR